MYLKTVTLLHLLALLLGGCPTALAQSVMPPGLVREEPKDGLYVETEQGFMVPYLVAIPETTASIEMVPVPGGSLRFEAQTGGQVVVDVEPFWLGRYEITWHQYASFMGLSKTFRKQATRVMVKQEQVDAVTAPTMLYDTLGRFEFVTSAECPATSLTQYAARQYTKWLSALSGAQYRLPSEAEWTYACVAPGKGVVQLPPAPVSKSALSRLAVFGKADGGPLPGGQRQPNALGVHDMLGNVWEWVLDSDETGVGIQHLPAGRYSVAQSIRRAPTRYAALACGGGCWDSLEDCQPLSRLVATEDFWREDPDYPPSVSWMAQFERDRSIGFRVLRTLSELSNDEMQVYWLPDSKALQQAVELRLEYRDVLGIARPEAISWSELHFPFAPLPDQSEPP